MTKQTAICDALTALGFKEVEYKTDKYRVFKRPDGSFYFVGKAGSLRTGKTVTDSFSISYAVPTLLKKVKK